ncbi:MAG: hypothetical protein HY748_14055 [Elusimicrobia bacterium]|nr:hypothetical protein [Elusimicrobiota bacterium]
MSLILTAALAALLAPAAPAGAVEWAPVADAQLLMGQVFEKTKRNSWQGNADLQLTPAVKLSDEWGVIPTYAGSYKGSKSVTDLGSGGQLFSDSMSHSLNAKVVWKRDKLKLKPSVGRRWEFLRETKDESWGGGLFDYTKLAGGLEAEYAVSDNIQARSSYDHYRIAFPNYRSLESKAPTDLSREQSAARTLDTVNHSWTGTGDFSLPFEGGWGRLSGNLTLRDYPEQRLVAVSGQLSEKLRSDQLRSVSAVVGYSRKLGPKAAATFSVQLTKLRCASNQDHYDAQANRFIGTFYSYDERMIKPTVGLVLGIRKALYSMSYLRVDRNYLGRVAQDEAGSYLSDNVTLGQDSFLFSLVVPIAYGMRLVAEGALTEARSNMRYEKFYRYNYTLSSHMVGLGYSF